MSFEAQTGRPARVLAQLLRVARKDFNNQVADHTQQYGHTRDSRIESKSGNAEWPPDEHA